MFPCFKPKDPVVQKAEQTDKRINQEIKRSSDDDRIKLLLLGAGDSGKSTVAKQMQLIHANGFRTAEERSVYTRQVLDNVFENIVVLVEGCVYEDLSTEAAEAAHRILDLKAEASKSADNHVTFTDQLVADIKFLWKNDEIQKTFRTRYSTIQVSDSTEYFFEAIDRIAENGYVPDTSDILRVRTKTTGIHEIDFDIGDYKFRMIDVGGQRSERRKWIHHFDGVTAILFLVSLSEYDQVLAEDGKTNRMLEAIQLFGETMNPRWFANTPFIIFFNKRDLFEEKIKKVPLSVCFPEYTGENTYEAASKYIESAFLSKVKNKKKMMYTHFTCATDTGNIEKIFDAVKGVLINLHLSQLGLGNGIDE